MEEKEMFIDLLKSVNRKGMDELIGYLENSDFFEAPASSKYHLACEGGLLKHSLNVYFNLEKMCGNEFPKSTIIIVSLLHDICKTEFYKKTIKHQKNENGKWEEVESYMIDDALPLGHGEKSIIILQNYIDLTVEEMVAIRWHMGGFNPKENYPGLNAAFHNAKLSVWLHMADLKATYIDEEKY